MLIDLFDAANAQITAVGNTVGQSPQQYNNAIFTLMENISNNVILPIAALIITGILCYELITMVTEKNNMADMILCKRCYSHHIKIAVKSVYGKTKRQALKGA
jgi:hypothetical protein